MPAASKRHELGRHVQIGRHSVNMPVVDKQKESETDGRLFGIGGTGRDVRQSKTVQIQSRTDTEALLRRAGGQYLALNRSLIRDLTDQHSTAGTAPTDSDSTKASNAGPVLCSA